MSTPYNSKHPTRPVPLARQAEVMNYAASRWFEFFDAVARHSNNTTRGDEPYKWFDVDAALADAAETVRLVAELASLIGDEEARRLIRSEIARRQVRPL